MKKLGTLNSNISSLLSELGHTDQIVIADCGLPIPNNIPKIDIALNLGQPSFLEVLDELLKNMEVETVIMAMEIKSNNVILHEKSIKKLNNYNVHDIEYISHDQFKKNLKNVKGVIRTGENTPYANIILKSGVIF